MSQVLPVLQCIVGLGRRGWQLQAIATERTRLHGPGWNDQHTACSNGNFPIIGKSKENWCFSKT